VPNVTIQLPIGYYPDPTIGRPVSNAYIFIGEPDTDPEVVLNQKQVFVLEENGSETAVSQPLRTGQGGVLTYNGSPVTAFVDGDHSMKVLDSGMSQVYYVPSLVDQGQALLVGWIDFDLDPTLPAGHQTGRLYWNKTTKTLTLMLEDGVSVDLGMAELARAHNATASAIDYGKAVYPTGQTGDVTTIALAKADAEATAGAYAFTLSTIAAGTAGYVMLSGKLPLLDTSAFAAADRVWLSESVAGDIQLAKPDIAVELGFVVTPSLGAGSIQVRPEPLVNDADVFRSDAIRGMEMSNTPADLINDITIRAGSCYDSTLSAVLKVPTATTKQIDVAWAEDNGATPTGGFPSAGGSGIVLTNDTWYHVFAIWKSDGTVSTGFDTNLDASVLLNNDNAGGSDYTLYRRIGTIHYIDGTDGIRDFVQIGNEFSFKGRITEGASLATTAWATETLTLPADIDVMAHIDVEYSEAGGSEDLFVSSPMLGDFEWVQIHSASFTALETFYIPTANASIRWKVGSGTADTSEIYTLGYTDTRGL
jgi:hypothetical protein